MSPALPLIPPRGIPPWGREKGLGDDPEKLVGEMAAMSAPMDAMEVGETPDGGTAPPKGQKGMNTRKQLEGLDD